eukprot:INCI11066.1.p1 GENE.INCI11066.1~~INCI11066.1.p1  ORF type:complete len:279 (+),score=46.62 INCI11066.1:167-1003(+)
MEVLNAVRSYAANFEYVSGETPLSSPYAPVVALVLYVITFKTLSSVFGVLSRNDTDPDKVVAAKRQRKIFKPFIVVHNVFLSVGSFAMLYGLITGYADQLQHESGFGAKLTRIVCDSGQPLFGKLQFWLWVFYLSKFYEFLDTFFLCVTMRPVIPLHWIHHVLTLMVAWIGLETKHTVMGLACVMNTFIHVIMYAYYAYKLINPEFEPWWKQHLTKLQMRQFMINVVGLAAWTYMDVYSEQNCTGEMWVIYVVLFVMVVFLGMFSAFSKKTYSRPKAK